MYRALDIANYFILTGRQADRPVTNMKLQKLIYYAQGWYMALHNGLTLFEEDFKRWDFGPVCPPVYNKFKKSGAQPILEPYDGVHPIEPQVKAFLDKIWKLYGKYTAVQLSELSHRETPWLVTPQFETISKTGLYSYFLSEKNRVPKQSGS
jgi:uncharacterized phage-associated protein